MSKPTTVMVGGNAHRRPGHREPCRGYALDVTIEIGAAAVLTTSSVR
jgi:hypothetical protein